MLARVPVIEAERSPHPHAPDVLERDLRTNLLRIIKAAGYEQWPQLFVNLRSSCRTELEERFPSYVIDSSAQLSVLFSSLQPKRQNQ